MLDSSKFKLPNPKSVKAEILLVVIIRFYSRNILGKKFGHIRFKISIFTDLVDLIDRDGCDHSDD